MDISTSVIILGSVLLVRLAFSVVRVPTGHIAFVEVFGRYKYTIDSGFHIVFPFIENLHLVSWSYPEEILETDGKRVTRTRQFNAHFFPDKSLKQTYDVPEISAFSSDNMEFSINGTFTYRIINARVAVYDEANIMQRMSDISTQAMRSVISSSSSEMLMYQESRVRDDILEQMQRSISPELITIETFSVQDLRMSETARRSFSDIALQRRNIELDKERREAVQMQKIQEIQMKTERLRLSKEACVAKQELAEAEARAESYHQRVLNEIELEYIREKNSILGPQNTANILIASKLARGLENASVVCLPKEALRFTSQITTGEKQ